jgi:hypothetical protein
MVFYSKRKELFAGALGGDALTTETQMLWVFAGASMDLESEPVFH